MSDKSSPVSGRYWFGIVLSAALLCLALTGCGRSASSTGQGSESLVMLDGTSVPVEEVEAAVAQAVDQAGKVSGVSIEIQGLALPPAKKIE